MENEEFDLSNYTIDVTDTTEEVVEYDGDTDEEQIERSPRNIFYAEDAFQVLPRDASPEDKEFHRKLKKSVKRLRRMQRSPLFEVQRMAILQEAKREEMMEEEENV